MKLFRCEHCGNIAEKIYDSGVSMVCCGENMTEIKAIEELDQKHTPVLKKDSNHLSIEVGELIHPMTPDHFIHFIFIVKDDTVVRYDVRDKELPIVNFSLEDDFEVYSYCNVHGLHKAVIKEIKEG